jgi:hypothetical protein
MEKIEESRFQLFFRNILILQKKELNPKIPLKTKKSSKKIKIIYRTIRIC